MGYLVSNKTSLYLSFQRELRVKVDGEWRYPFAELKDGCWAKFHKHPAPGGPCKHPHIRVSAHNNPRKDGLEFEGRKVHFTDLADGRASLCFAHKTSELRALPRFSPSLSDTPPLRLRSGVWLFPLPQNLYLV